MIGDIAKQEAKDLAKDLGDEIKKGVHSTMGLGTMLSMGQAFLNTLGN